MATLTMFVPDAKWDVIARIAALEGMGVPAWLDDFIAQQMHVVLETVRQELEMDDAAFTSYLDTMDASKKEHHQAVLDAFVEGIMATYDFDGLLALHERSFQ